MTQETWQEGEAWAPLPTPVIGMTTEQYVLCVDRAKYNLFWLVEPRVDTEGIEAARLNPIADSINGHMSKDLRAQLKQLPMTFMRWWESQNHTDFVVTSGWYPNYMTIMKERVGKAQAYALGRKEEDNVVMVNFRRSA